MNIKFIKKQAFCIYLTKEVDEKIRSIVKLSKDEVGFLGFVERDKNSFVITDIHIPKQEVNATTCEIDEDDQCAFVEQLLLEGRDEDINKIRFWGHSHDTMGVSPSGQDDKQILELADGLDYFIMGIFNKYQHSYFSIVFPELNLILEDVDSKVIYPDMYDLDKEIEQELSEKVSKKPFTSYRGKIWKDGKWVSSKTNKYNYYNGYSYVSDSEIDDAFDKEVSPFEDFLDADEDIVVETVEVEDNVIELDNKNLKEI